MELAELQQLVTEGESERLEFKKSTGELRAGMTTLCALLNGAGGQVVFGANATSLSPVGLRRANGSGKRSRSTRSSLSAKP